jgi:hypothetical protein
MLQCELLLATVAAAQAAPGGRRYYGENGLESHDGDEGFPAAVDELKDGSAHAAVVGADVGSRRNEAERLVPLGDRDDTHERKLKSVLLSDAEKLETAGRLLKVCDKTRTSSIFNGISQMTVYISLMR